MAHAPELAKFPYLSRATAAAQGSERDEWATARLQPRRMRMHHDDSGGEGIRGCFASHRMRDPTKWRVYAASRSQFTRCGYAPRRPPGILQIEKKERDGRRVVRRRSWCITDRESRRQHGTHCLSVCSYRWIVIKAMESTHPEAVIFGAKFRLQGNRSKRKSHHQSIAREGGAAALRNTSAPSLSSYRNTHAPPAEASTAG